MPLTLTLHSQKAHIECCCPCFGLSIRDRCAPADSPTVLWGQRITDLNSWLLPVLCPKVSGFEVWPTDLIFPFT